VAAAQWFAKCVRPIVRSGQMALRHVPITTSWMLRPNQGRKILGAVQPVLTRMKVASAKRQVMQSLAGMYPGNALLFEWGLKPSPMCTLCAHVSETQTHVQCVCPALKGERIRVHHSLAELLLGSIERAAQSPSPRLKVPRPAMDKLMHELIAKCLVSLGDVYRTRQAALHV
jgi:hypothetical protein